MDETIPAGTPAPLWYVLTRILAGSVFFGPLGALVGLGLGLIFSAIMQRVRGK
jgi:hypothetical protein